MGCASRVHHLNLRRLPALPAAKQAEADCLVASPPFDRRHRTGHGVCVSVDYLKTAVLSVPMMQALDRPPLALRDHRKSTPEKRQALYPLR